MGEKGKFYITTAIPYSNAEPHLGTAFEAIGTDIVARWKRLTGHDVFFLTGMDENSQKTVKAADEHGVTPQELIDSISGKFKELWAKLGISYDDFIRTTEPRHREVVTELFKRVHESGDIYKGTYAGSYCTGCENFLSEDEIVDGKCPVGHEAIEWVSEEGYFFRLSKYTDAVREHVEQHPEFIEPDFRRNEIMNSYLIPGLKDVFISRESAGWGIPLPIDPSRVLYVWVDALVNYLTGCGFLTDDDMFNHYWPADLHVIGKDIIRFHTTHWPAMLMSVGLPLPKRVFTHGFVNIEGIKMSKSAGTVVDPGGLVEEFGADSLRYFLMREAPYAQDVSFSRRKLAERHNRDLANDLGNLLHRTLTMVGKYMGGTVPEPAAKAEGRALREAASRLPEALDAEIDAFRFNRALERTWNVIREANRYVEESKPWVLAKDASQKERLQAVLYTLLESIRLVSICLWPFMPQSSEEMRRQLGLDATPDATPVDQDRWGLLRPGTKVNKGNPIFPHIELSQ